MLEATSPRMQLQDTTTCERVPQSGQWSVVVPKKSQWIVDIRKKIQFEHDDALFSQALVRNGATLGFG
jgi:hypothetical protein